MKNLNTIFAIVLCSAFSASAAKAENVVKIGTVLDQAPFEYRDSNGKVSGIETPSATECAKS